MFTQHIFEAILVGGMSYCSILHPVYADTPLPLADQRPEVRWLATALMLLMIAALIYTGREVVRSFRRTIVVSASSWEKYVTPLVAIIGMAVASSLASVQTQDVGANLDPGDGSLAVLNCPYAKLFDLFPVNIMGRQAYSIVFWAGLWVLPRSGKSVRKAYRGILVLTIAGTLFSLYLTFLEMFVVRTACGQCLLSAAIMTLLMIVALVPALQGSSRSRTGHWVKEKTLFARNRRKPNDH